MANVTVLIRTVSDDATPVAVDGVLVQVYSEAGAYLTEGTTGTITPGEVEFTLNGDSPAVNYDLVLTKDGLYFAPAPTKQIAVNDPPVPANEFEFVASVGPSAQLVTFHVADDQLVPEVVEDVTIRVYDDADQYLTEVLTDAAGEAEITLAGEPDPGTEYIVRLSKRAYTFDGGHVHKIYVLDPVVAPATNEFDFTAVARTLPESTDPDMCRISGYLVNTGGQALKNVVIRFIARKGFPEEELGGLHWPGDPSIIDNKLVAADLEVKTDEDGYVEALLPRGGRFDIHIHGLENPSGIISLIYVPDAPSCALIDLVLPYVASVAYGSDPINVGVGLGVDVPLTITLSSGAVVEDFAGIQELLEFTSSDEGVATVAVSEEGTMRVTGVAAGTATISVERKDYTVAPRRPDVPDIVVTDPTVQVS